MIGLEVAEARVEHRSVGTSRLCRAIRVIGVFVHGFALLSNSSVAEERNGALTDVRDMKTCAARMFPLPSAASSPPMTPAEFGLGLLVTSLVSRTFER
jgi:hypothetical protein